MNRTDNLPKSLASEERIEDLAVLDMSLSVKEDPEEMAKSDPLAYGIMWNTLLTSYPAEESASRSGRDRVRHS